MIDIEVGLPYVYDRVAVGGHIPCAKVASERLDQQHMFIYSNTKIRKLQFSIRVLNSSLGYDDVFDYIAWPGLCMEDEDDLAGCQVVQMFQFLLLSNYRGFTNSSATDTMPFMASNTFYSLWLFCDVVSEHL